MLRSLRGNSIYIDLSKKELYLYEQANLSATYPVAVGKPSTPSPIGSWQIANKKIINYDSIYGSRWMGLSEPSYEYGIHGTNAPSSIGNAVSHGCIRMNNSDIEELFPSIGIGTPVIIIPNLSNANPYQPTIQNTTTLGSPYTIRPGDTLWKISQAYNIPVTTLLKLNPNINPNQLTPGQTIYLP